MRTMENQNIENIINENKVLKIEIEKLKKENQSLKYENQVLKNGNTNLKNNSDCLNSTDKEEIKELRERCRTLNEEKERIYNDLISKFISNAAEIKNFNELPYGEKLIAVNFISVDQRINCSIVCKNKTGFYEIEGALYKKYPEYKKKENYFTFNGTKIERWDTLEENGMVGYTIILNTIDNK